MTVNERRLFQGAESSSASAANAHGIERTSEIVARFARENAGRDVTVGEIVHALQDRSFGVLMIMFALPNAVIPGISWILGAPIILFGIQLALGRKQAWLPGFMLRRTLSANMLAAIAQRVEKFLLGIEKWAKPRWLFLISNGAQRLIGIYLALLALVLMVPIPFGNAGPAFAISFLSVGIIEKDGAAVAIGIGLGLLGTLLVIVLVGGVIAAALSALTWFHITL
jgi:hypothetical protein